MSPDPAKVRPMVLPAVERQGPIEAWIIDDTGFPKKGKHSVGVARQYCGQLGKQDNCQIAVSLSIANRHASLPVAWRLYLPRDWASDAARRKKAKVPEEIGFKTKPEIALEQIRSACEAGLPRGVVLMDAGGPPVRPGGVKTDLREDITALDLTHVAGILPHVTVWANAEAPLPPKGAPDLRVVDVKEKFGGLRYYVRQVPEKYALAVAGAKERSFETCGKSGRLIRSNS